MLVALAALALLCAARCADPPGAGGQSIPMTLCGRRLADAREVFCIEAGLLVRKRSVGEAPRRRRARRGIVDDCCYKPCTRDQLLEYC